MSYLVQAGTSGACDRGRRVQETKQPGADGSAKVGELSPLHVRLGRCPRSTPTSGPARSPRSVLAQSLPLSH